MTEESFGVPFDVDPSKVEQAGWAVVFGAEEGNDVKAALEPLIEHRRRRIGDARTKVLEHRPGEGWTDWLARHRTAPGNINPDKVPYYLLLIGGPNHIPFSLQYLLDTEYAVGRLDFDDAAGYRSYVAGLIDYEETDAAPHDAAATFFGTRHPFDGATQLSADSLVRPLIRSSSPAGDSPPRSRATGSTRCSASPPQRPASARSSPVQARQAARRCSSPRPTGWVAGRPAMPTSARGTARCSARTGRASAR